MYNGKGVPRRKLFLRIFIIFMLIIIPVYSFGIYFYNWGKGVLREKEVNTILAQCNNYMKSIETEIKRVKQVQSDFSSNDDLNKFSLYYDKIDEIEKFEIYNSLQEYLILIKNTSAIIKHPYIFFLKPGISIAAPGGETPTYYKLTAKEHEIVKIYEKSKIDPIVSLDGRFFVCYTNTSRTSLDIPYDYVIVLELSVEEFKKMQDVYA